MPHGFEEHDDLTLSDHDVSALKDLERQTIDEIRKHRQHERLEVSIPVTLFRGNSSEAGEPPLEGTTGDVSKGGCRATFSMPVGVGDIYRLEFRGEVHPPVVFARCVRCSFLRENAFEAGFRFFNEVVLGGQAPGEDGLI